MAKQAIQLDREKFQEVISSLEAKQTFNSRSSLWGAIEQTDWAKKLSPRPLTGQVAMLKAKELNLEIKTPLGRKGAEKGVSRQGRVRKRISLDVVNLIDLSEKYSPLKKKIATGSLKAVVKAMCLQCTNEQPLEIKMCTLTHCAQHAIRPFQG